MKVFLSWSGEVSRQVALILRDWLPDVINAVEPWMSSEDIDKGAQGLQAIADQLENTSFGIVCLTRENQERSWINFEAGALSKSVGDDGARVATFLIDIDAPAQVVGPLGQFQATKFNKDEVTQLIKSLDKATGSPRADDRVERLVDQLWSQLKDRVDLALQEAAAHADSPIHERTERDMLEELIDGVRELRRSAGAVESSLVSESGADFSLQVLTKTRTRQGHLIEKIIRSYAPQAEDITVELLANGGFEVTANNAPVSPEDEEKIKQELMRSFGVRTVNLLFVPF